MTISSINSIAFLSCWCKRGFIYMFGFKLAVTKRGEERTNPIAP